MILGGLVLKQNNKNNGNRNAILYMGRSGFLWLFSGGGFFSVRSDGNAFISGCDRSVVTAFC